MYCQPKLQIGDGIQAVKDFWIDHHRLKLPKGSPNPGKIRAGTFGRITSVSAVEIVVSLTIPSHITPYSGKVMSVLKSPGMNLEVCVRAQSFNELFAACSLDRTHGYLNRF